MIRWILCSLHDLTQGLATEEFTKNVLILQWKCKTTFHVRWNHSPFKSQKLICIPYQLPNQENRQKNSNTWSRTMILHIGVSHQDSWRMHRGSQPLLQVRSSSLKTGVCPLFAENVHQIHPWTLIKEKNEHVTNQNDWSSQSKEHRIYSAPQCKSIWFKCGSQNRV